MTFSAKLKTGKTNEMIRPIPFGPEQIYPNYREKIPTDPAAQLARLNIALLNFLRFNPMCHVTALER